MNRKTLKKGISVFVLIGVLAFGVVGDSWSGMSARAIASLDCNVMPLGDSITVGKYSGIDTTSPGGDSDDIGYRKDLHDLLVGAGYSVDFVGTNSNGSTYPFSDPQHEGHNGWTDTQIADNIYNDGGENWLSQNPADVIFLHIGTNSPRNPSEAERILDEIDAYQVDTGSKVIVIIARIIGTVADGSSAFSGYNDLVESLVTARADYGTELFMVDMEGIAGWNYSIWPGDPTGDMIDNLHPYATGYTKMAAVWYAKYDDVFGTAGSNAAPNVTNPGTRSNSEGDTISLPISASDPDVESITYAAYNLPPGLSINPSTGLISGTIDSTASSGSPYAVDIVVADGNLCGSSSTSFTWNVSESNLPPNIVQPADQENVEGESVSLQINATDPNGDNLTYSAPNLPSGLSISQSGLISGVISFDASSGSPYTVEVTVEDDGSPNLSDMVSFTWTVNDYVPGPPDVTNPGDQKSKAGDMVLLQIEASDPDGDNISFAAENLPPNLVINPISGVISGEIKDWAILASPYTVTVTVTDDDVPPLNTKISFSWIIASDETYLPLVIR